MRNLCFWMLCVFASINLHGQSWIPQGHGLLPVGYAIKSISAVNDTIIWLTASVESNLHFSVEQNPIASDHLIIVLRSIDGGETWSSRFVMESIGRVSFDIQGLDANTALLTTQGYDNLRGRALYKTEDGGVSWTQKLLHRACGVFIHILDEQHLYCQANRAKAWSNNAGESWNFDLIDTYADMESNPFNSGNNASSAVGDTVWVGTTKGNIVRTTNYGAHSEFIKTGFPGWIECVSFKDHLHGMLYYYNHSTNESGTARTSDGGTTWAATPSKPETLAECSITYVPGTNGAFIAVCYSFFISGEIILTTDFGESWISGGVINNAYTNSIDFSSSAVGWVATDVITREDEPIVYKWSGDAFLTEASSSRHLVHEIDSSGVVHNEEKFRLVLPDSNSARNLSNKQKTDVLRTKYELQKIAAIVNGLSEENEFLLNKESQKKKTAFAGIALILLLGGFGFYVFRRKKKLEGDRAILQERLRISRDLHDEVGATLSGLAMYSHLAKEQIRDASITDVDQSLNIMQQSASEMVSKLSDIVWLLNPEHDALEKLVEKLEDNARHMAAINGMQVKMVVADHLTNVRLPVESRRSIYLICKEAINNSVKYSLATIMEIQVRNFNHILEFVLQDNGVGFDLQRVKRGNGLDNMQKRAEEIGARLLLDTAPGRGTKISLQCKVTH